MYPNCPKGPDGAMTASMMSDFWHAFLVMDRKDSGGGHVLAVGGEHVKPIRSPHLTRSLHVPHLADIGFFLMKAEVPAILVRPGRNTMVA